MSSQRILAYFCPRIIFAHLKLVFLPQLSIDARQARKNLTTKDKSLATGLK